MNLSEKEKRAINTLKQISDFDDLCENCYYDGTKQKQEHGCWGCRENAKDIVLNLVEKLQKENEELKHNDNYISIQKIQNKIKELDDLKLCGGSVHQAITEEKILMLKELKEESEEEE